MTREQALGVVVLLLLLGGGFLIGRTLRPDRPTDMELQDFTVPHDQGFRDWFWERRTFDLMTQVGLIFAGALGIAAILPGRDEAPSQQDVLHVRSGRSP
jgi:hypothetical protein